MAEDLKAIAVGEKTFHVKPKKNEGHTDGKKLQKSTFPRLGSFMESLGISTDDVWGLFLLIDADENGVIDLDEFVSGCMQLHGPAKSLQVTWRSKRGRIGQRLGREGIPGLIRQVFLGPNFGIFQL